MAHKTLYICYFGIREPLVRTQVLPYLREIRKGGVNVSILTFEPDEEDGELGRRGEEAIKKELAADGITWFSLPYHKRPSVPATAYDVLNGSRLIKSLVAEHGFDILHARSHVPMLMAALARKLSRRKPKILFDIRGFFPEEYTDAGIWPEGGWLYRSVKRVERWLMKEADGFVVLTEKARDILFGEGEKGGKEQQNPKSQIPNLKAETRPVEVIPCCVDLERFAGANADSRATIRRELGIHNRKVLVYVGAFGGWYLTEEMVDLFLTFKSQEPDGFALVLTQSDPETVKPKLLAGGYNDDELFISKVDSSAIPRYLSAADIAVSFIKPCYSKQASSPTKNAEYLACGLPIIANSGVGDVDAMILENRIGSLVRDFDQEAYINALSEIEELGNIGDRCREVARREFDLETVGGIRYRNIYSQLMNNEGGE